MIEIGFESAIEDFGGAMSRAARWVLGAFSAFFALVLVASERMASSKAPVLIYLVTLFCVAICVACFSSKLRSGAIRLIGAMVFLATVSYLVDELATEPAKKYSSHSEPHWINAIFALLMFGLPGIYVALRGTYPSWGEGASAFKGKPTPHVSDRLTDEENE
jgi:hypothetical protein